MAYRFKDRICTVEIEDKKYPISFSQAMSERVTEAAVKLRELKGCKDEAAAFTNRFADVRTKQ